MNIGIDARILERKMTGIGRFLHTFLAELKLIDQENNYFLFTYEKIRIDESYFNLVTTGNSILPQKIFAPFWMNFILPRKLKQNKIDVFFSVNQLTPIVKVRGVKFILVLHDVIYKVDKSFHPWIYRKYLEFFTFFSIRKSDVIVTVSNFSKSDILRFYKVPDEKIKVVYQAAEPLFKPDELSLHEANKIKGELKLSSKIVLYLGMIENRKNIDTIIKVADELVTYQNEISLLIIGKIGYGGKKILTEIEKRKNIKYIAHIDDQLLKKIYNISFVFLFPSYYEGFGYPPLEAMQSGLPVLASNNTSLKEIINNGGILHDPNDYRSFSQDIINLLNDPVLYNSLKKRGIERARYFDMHKTTTELVAIFNSLHTSLYNYR